jgi:hypothetical protein
MCAWLANLSDSPVLGELTSERLEEIGSAAEGLAIQASEFRLKGEAQATLDQSRILLQNIKEAARDDRGLVSIPTFKGLLSNELERLLLRVRALYLLPANQAPCAAFDP